MRTELSNAPAKEIQRILGERWRSTPEGIKDTYKKRAHEAMEKYYSDMETFYVRRSCGVTMLLLVCSQQLSSGALPDFLNPSLTSPTNSFSTTPGATPRGQNGQEALPRAGQSNHVAALSSANVLVLFLPFGIAASQFTHCMLLRHSSKRPKCRTRLQSHRHVLATCFFFKKCARPCPKICLLVRVDSGRGCLAVALPSSYCPCPPLCTTPL